jgi:hypothetical protein
MAALSKEIELPIDVLDAEDVARFVINMPQLHCSNLKASRDTDVCRKVSDPHILNPKEQ